MAIGFNSQGLEITDKPPRLREPALKPDSLHFASNRLLRSITPQKIVSTFEAAEYEIADQIELAAMMEETDDHLNGTLEIRRAAVLGLEFVIEPGDPDDARSKKAAELAQQIAEQSWFRLGLRDWLLRAIWHQWAAAELLWEDFLPVAMYPVDPERWFFERETRRPQFYLSRSRGGEKIDAVAGQFAVHSYSAVYTMPGRFAKVRALATLWLLKRLDLIGWGEMVDSWAVPFVVMEYDNLTDAEINTALERFLTLASRRAVAVKKGTTVEMHDVPDAAPHKDFQAFVRAAMSVALLGQHSSQIAKEGQETGATLQGQVRTDIRNMDAWLLDASLNQNVFAPLTLWRFGPDVAPPRIKHTIEDAADPEQRGRIFLQAQQIGLALVSEQVYGDMGLERPAEGVPEVLGPVAGAGAEGQRGTGPEGQNGQDARATQAQPGAVVGGEQTVQDTGLNGAQLASLREMLLAAAQQQLPPEAVRIMIKLGFPAMDEGKIDQMINAVAKWKPPQEPSPKSIQNGGGAAAPPRAAPSIDDRTDDQRKPDGPLASDPRKADALSSEMERRSGEDHVTALSSQGTGGTGGGANVSTETAAAGVLEEETIERASAALGAEIRAGLVERVAGAGSEAELRKSFNTEAQRHGEDEEGGELLALALAVADAAGRVREWERKNKTTSLSSAILSASVPLCLTLLAAEREEEPSPRPSPKGRGSEDAELVRKHFEEALQAFRKREEVFTAEEFERLTAAAREKAFTVARVAERDALERLRVNLEESIAQGQSWREWLDGAQQTIEQQGLTQNHARAIYQTNVALANTAGRDAQAAQLGAIGWRKLPSSSDAPRPAHAQYDGVAFSLSVPRPPWGHGCRCEWEALYDGEAEESELVRAAPGVVEL